LIVNEIAAAPYPYSGRVRAWVLKLSTPTDIHGELIFAGYDPFPHCRRGDLCGACAIRVSANEFA